MVVFENLKGIRDNISSGKEFQQWIFSKFYEIVEYKATDRSIKTVQIDPRNTSKKCSKYGNISDSNRDGDKFKCVNCDRELHADFNASKLV